MRTAAVFDLPVAATTPEDACALLERWVRANARKYVVFANVHVVETAMRRPDVAEAVATAGLVLPDGAPVAWAARRRAGCPSSRIAGMDVFDAICRVSPSRGYRHFFYGSTDETLAALETALRTRYPGLEIAGTRSPPVAPGVELRFDDLRAIDAARPDFVWVGLGAPKQELWMRMARPHLQAPVLLGIGAVFDFASGRKQRAPELLQRLWLEWAYRLAREPRRLAGRYLTTNAAFTLRAARSMLKGEL